MSSINMVTFRTSPWSRVHPLPGLNNPQTMHLVQVKDISEMLALTEKPSLHPAPHIGLLQNVCLFTALCTILAGEKFTKQDQVYILQSEAICSCPEFGCFPFGMWGQPWLKNNVWSSQCDQPIKQRECCKFLAVLTH